MSEIDSALKRAIDFIGGSSCIDDSETKAKGGFYGFQNTSKPLRKTDKPFIFYEISGYGINLLLKLQQWYNESSYLESAKKTGDSILLAQIEDGDSKMRGAIYDRYYPHNNEFFETAHAYPNGVCAGALCELYQKTKDEKYRKAAISIKDWLFQITIKKNDSCIGFKEFYSPGEESHRIFPYESICIPFILLKFQKELDLLENEKKQLIQSISWAKKSQTEVGFFPFFYSLENGKFNKTSYSHFTIYPLYNLMGFPLSDLEDFGYKGCFESYVKCGNWMTKVQDKNGGFFTYYFQDKHVWHQQSPAVAQALCAFTLLYEKTSERKFYESAKKAAEWIIKNQIKEGRFSGSFYWIYPNKHFSNIQKKIMYAKERISNKFSNSNQITDVTVLLDKIPIWPVQFAVEGLYHFKNLMQNSSEMSSDLS